MARIVGWVGGVFYLVSGLWAMVAPRSFFEKAAVFEPYNQHFIQDIGAFMLGLGAVLLVALVATTDGLAVALLGVGIGSAAHAISHIVGRDLGGKPALDIPMLLVSSVALLAGGWARLKTAGSVG